MNQFFTKCKHFELVGIFQRQDNSYRWRLSDPKNYPFKERGQKWSAHYAIAMRVNNRPVQFSAGIDTFFFNFFNLNNDCMKRKLLTSINQIVRSA